MNLGSNFTHRVTLRLNDEQYNFLITVSNLLGVSPSDYLRMSVNAGMIGTSDTVNRMSSGKALEADFMKGLVGTNNENVKTDIYDII